VGAAAPVEPAEAADLADETLLEAPARIEDSAAAMLELAEGPAEAAAELKLARRELREALTDD
jgi:hypothetical protein